MKILRTLLPAVLLATVLALPGCILTSAQVLATFDLDNPITITGADAVEGAVVDLNTVPDYEDNRDKIDGVLDLALLGEFVHVAGQPIALEVWMTRSVSNYTLATQVMNAPDAVKLWGTFTLAAGSKQRITWDRSAELFDDAGRKVLIEEIKGDGVFTLDALGTGSVYSFRINNGAFVVLLDAGV